MTTPTPLTGKTATVSIERNGLSIRIDDVPASESAMVAYDLLLAMRVLRASYSELTPDLNPVPGGTPLAIDDEEWDSDGRRRAGFR